MLLHTWWQTGTIHHHHQQQLVDSFLCSKLTLTCTFDLYFSRWLSVWICFTSVMIDTIIEHGAGGRLCEKMLHIFFLVSLYSIAIWLYTRWLYKWIGLDWVETWHWLYIDIVLVALVLLVKHIECILDTHTEYSNWSHRLYITLNEWIHTHSHIHTNFHFSPFLLVQHSRMNFSPCIPPFKYIRVIMMGMTRLTLFVITFFTALSPTIFLRCFFFCDSCCFNSNSIFMFDVFPTFSIMHSEHKNIFFWFEFQTRSSSSMQFEWKIIISIKKNQFHNSTLVGYIITFGLNESLLMYRLHFWVILWVTQVYFTAWIGITFTVICAK